MQRLIGAVREARVHRPRLAGRVQHLVQRVVDDDGQALAAELGVAGQRRPAGFDVLPVCLLEALGRADHAIALVGAALAVTGLVQREDHVGAELAGFLDNLVDGVRVDVGVRRHRLEFGFCAEQFMEHELHVAQRCGVLAHQKLLGGLRCRHVHAPRRLQGGGETVAGGGVRYGKTESVC
ncbi:hypothetical protein D3C86_1359000 [compost metagenome]